MYMMSHGVIVGGFHREEKSLENIFMTITQAGGGANV
jgi:hypothetical protein